jgi:thiosulfate/3-mercaptopyruvate sulfurtransferase
VSDAKLVQVAELHDELGDPSLSVLDATAILRRELDGGPYVVESGRHSFDECHIPGAVFADVPGDLSDSRSRFRFTVPSPKDFARAIGALGVGDDSRVVVYAQATPMWATRLWWLLRYFGFADVWVLDGGLVAWIEAGFEVSASPSEIRARTFVATPRPELLATKDDVVRFVGGEPACLVNALPSKAFRGEGPGAYSRPGRIPGSISLPSGDLVDPSTGRFLDSDHLARVLEPVAASSDGPVVAYCGGGISATVDVFALSLVGRDDVKLYDGSLTEWSADPSLPLIVD